MSDSDGKPHNKIISFFLPGLYGGGAERVFLNLAEGIARRNYEVEVVVTQVEGSFASQLPFGVKLHSLREAHLSSFRTIAGIPALANYLNKRQPAALISALHANLAAILAKKMIHSSTRLIITEHNTFTLQNKLLYFGVSQFNEFMVKRYYPCADEIIAVSGGVAQDLARVTGLKDGRIRVIYNPIVTPELLEKAREPIQHPWFRLGSPPVVLAAGRLEEQKDYATLLLAAKLVLQEKPAHFLILGEGSLRHQLDQMAFDLEIKGQVEMPGFVKNPYAYMTNSRIFVLSSRWEGLPTVLVEALACGTPVISTDCPSGPKEILEDGKYGRLVPMRDPVALARAILEELSREKSTPPPESWQEFTLEKTVDKYLEVIFEPA